MDLNDPAVMAEVLVEREAEAVRQEAAARPIQMFQRGMLTVEELATELTRLARCELEEL